MSRRHSGLSINQVGDALERELGERVQRLQDSPGFIVDIGPDPLLVQISAAGPSRSSLTVYARPADGLQVTPEIALLLLHANFAHEIPFGALGINDQGNISLSYVLMGESLDLDSLSFLLHLVAQKLQDIQDLLAEHVED